MKIKTQNLKFFNNVRVGDFEKSYLGLVAPHTCVLAISLPVGTELPLAAAIHFKVSRALSSLPLSTSNLALSGNHYRQMHTIHNQTEELTWILSEFKVHKHEPCA